MGYLKAGLKQSAIKFIKILGWVALCAILTEIGTKVGNWQPTTTQFVLIQGGLNAFLPAVIQWAATKETNAAN
jgi:hypothetical protein